jgi:hypothetical protein
VFVSYVTEYQFRDAAVLLDCVKDVPVEGCGIKCVDGGGPLNDPVVCGKQTLIVVNRWIIHHVFRSCFNGGCRRHGVWSNC